MIRFLGMLLQMQHRTFSEIYLLLTAFIICLACMVGCTSPFHGPTLPQKKGIWVGEAPPVVVLDNQNVIHEVIQIKLVSPAMNKSHSADTLQRYKPSPENPLFPLLVDRRSEAVDADSSEYLGKQVRVKGILMVGDNATLSGSGRPIVRLSDAAVIIRHGSKERVYTSKAESLLIFESIELVK